MEDFQGNFDLWVKAEMVSNICQ